VQCDFLDNFLQHKKWGDFAGKKKKKKKIQWKTLNHVPSSSEFYFGKVTRIRPLQNKIRLGLVFNPLFGNCPVWRVRTTSFNPG